MNEAWLEISQWWSQEPRWNPEDLGVADRRLSMVPYDGNTNASALVDKIADPVVGGDGWRKVGQAVDGEKSWAIYVRYVDDSSRGVHGVQLTRIKIWTTRPATVTPDDSREGWRS